MPQVRFTQNIQRHVACPAKRVDGDSLRQALDHYFSMHATARDYVLDEHGSLRKHMAIFINGKPVRDRDSLSDQLPKDATVDVMQALSGG